MKETDQIQKSIINHLKKKEKNRYKKGCFFHFVFFELQ
jgi:hypothetical protein